MESLILSVLGDIISFNNGTSFIHRKRFTKAKYGESFRENGIEEVVRLYYFFILFGGVNRDLKHHRYSMNTIVLFATLKGMIKDKDFTIGCKEEYSKIYKKYSDKNEPNRYIIPFDYLNSFSKLDESYTTENNPNANDAHAITRIIPFALLFWKKDKKNENRKKMVKQIILNILITHNNVKCYLSAITLGLFISYGKNGIPSVKWCHNLVEYLLSDELDKIIKELDLYNDTYVIEKEQYLTMWNEYIGLYLKKALNKNSTYMIQPHRRYQYLHEISDNEDEFTYGIRGDDSILCAYDTLLYCKGSWEKMLLMGTVGPTNNSVMGTLCGALFGAEYKFESVWIDKDLNEEWVKKTIKLGKSLGL